MKVQRRYRLRLEQDWTWTVVDVFTGLPFWHRNEPAFGLDQREAFNLAVMLNAIESERIRLAEPER